MRASRTAAGFALVGLVAAAPARPADAVEGDYAVDGSRSTLTVLAYRAGPFARLGHNHVLVAHGPTGRIHVPADPAGVRVSLALPVAAFVVDDAAARAAEGKEFAGTPTPADVDATRRNLLGPKLLDAARHPELRLTAAGASGGPREWRVPITVEIAGRTRVVDAPVRVAREGDALIVEGAFPLAQTALGLTPLRVALGAVQVRDELGVRFRIVAPRAPVAEPTPR